MRDDHRLRARSQLRDDDKLRDDHKLRVRSQIACVDLAFMTPRGAENAHFPCRHDAVASPMSYLYPLCPHTRWKNGFTRSLA